MKLDFNSLVLQGKLVYVMWFLERRQERLGGHVPDPDSLMSALNIVLLPEHVVRYEPPYWTLAKFKSVKNWDEPGFLDSTELFRSSNVFDMIGHLTRMLFEPPPSERGR